MSYDKATFKVKVANEGVVRDVKEIVEDLHTPGQILVQVVDEYYYTEGSGTDGSKVVVVEVDEYSGEIPLFTNTLDEKIPSAEIIDSSYVAGGSEVEDA